MAESGERMLFRQARSGPASKIQTTMRYVHPDESDILEIAQAVQKARAKKGTTIFTTPTQPSTTETHKM